MFDQPAVADESAMTVTAPIPIDASDFDPADFETQPGLLIPNDITQNDVQSIALLFSESPAAETTLNYNGDAPGMCSPQSIAVEPA